MSDAPRLNISFAEANAVWLAIFAWRFNPNGDKEQGGILDAIGALVAVRCFKARAEALEEAAKIAEAWADLGRSYAVGDWEEAQVDTANRIAKAIRESASE